MSSIASKVSRLAFGLCLFCLSGANGWADPSAQEVRAAFIARIAEFITWPQGALVFEDNDPSFTICVYGDHPIQDPLSELPQFIRIQDSPVVVRRIEQPIQALGCHVLFVPQSGVVHLPKLLETLRGRPVLTVGDSREMMKRGVMLGLLEDQGRLRIHIHAQRARHAGLKVSSRLLKLATLEE